MLRGFIAAAIVFVLKSFGIVVEQDAVEGIVFGFIVIFAAWRARQNAMPLSVVNAAGFTAEDIHRRAKSPSVRPVTEAS
jgi:hypothetical protein